MFGQWGEGPASLMLRDRFGVLAPLLRPKKVNFMARRVEALKIDPSGSFDFHSRSDIGSFEI
jgi:hypothetical protein